MTDEDRPFAWDELHAATPPGWFVGRPGQRQGGEWARYAFDSIEKAQIGRRSREWTAVGQTEEECIREMARCLREIGRARPSAPPTASECPRRSPSNVLNRFIAANVRIEAEGMLRADLQ